MLDKNDKIFIAGHNGMVGSAILRSMQSNGFSNFALKSHAELDLTDEAAVRRFYAEEKPDVAVIVAAKVGGILANSRYPVEFMRINLQIALNTICGAYEAGVKRLLYLGSTCIYPRNAAQPIAEASLLTSELEKTNEAYALAKICGVKLCEYYRKEYGALFHSGMPTNLYGPGDNYHPENSHVLPALIRRFHEAKVNNLPEVVMWGSGAPLREFLHVDDLADACLHLLNLDSPPDLINLGSGEEVSIRELGLLVAEAVGYQGKITFDSTKPDGTPRKLCDTTLLRSTGWAPKISLREGIASTYQNFLDESAAGTLRG